MKQRYKDPLFESVALWVDRVGKNQVAGRLILRGVSVTVADCLVHGRYKSHPNRPLFLKIREEMAKDGLILSIDGRLEAS